MIVKEKTILLLNKSNTRFRISEISGKEKFMPGTTRSVPEAQAKKLLAMYPHDIITVKSLDADGEVEEVVEAAPVKEDANKSTSDSTGEGTKESSNEGDSSNEEGTKEDGASNAPAPVAPAAPKLSKGKSPKPKQKKK